MSTSRGLSDSQATRFWPKVDKTAPAPSHRPELGSCWVWSAAKRGNGYGAFAISRSYSEYAHRVSWAMANGPIPKGLQVLHHCDNRLCVRPSHLFVGTHNDNMADMVAKNRQQHAQPKLRGELSPASKLTLDDVRYIRRSAESSTVLGQRYGVSASLIRQVVRGVAWAWAK